MRRCAAQTSVLPHLGHLSAGEVARSATFVTRPWGARRGLARALAADCRASRFNRRTSETTIWMLGACSRGVARHFEASRVAAA